MRRIVSNAYDAEYKMTVGVDFAQKKYVYSHEDKMVTLWYHFWDVAGQDYYSRLVSAYYRDACACLLVCDLSLDNSFGSIRQWFAEVSAKVLQQNGQRVPTILVCNKLDL